MKASKQFVNATRYSAAGFDFLVRSELAARIELYCFMLAIGVYAYIGADWIHFIVGGVLLFVLLAMEALNTAVEVIIDRISPEISETGRRAKDLGSFAVMCLLFTNAIHFCYVLSVTLSSELGLKTLAGAVVGIFVIAALYTKLQAHDPRRNPSK